MGFYRNRSELLNEEEYKAQKMRFFHIKIKETAKSEMLQNQQEAGQETFSHEGHSSS